MVQMSAQYLLSKTEKAQISGQMQIICIAYPCQIWNFKEILVVGPIGYWPNRGFHHHHHHHHHLHHHPTVSQLLINSHIQAISAALPTYHTSPKRGQRQGSSRNVKDKKTNTKTKTKVLRGTFRYLWILWGTFNYFEVLLGTLRYF